MELEKYVLGLPILGWLGWLQKDKVSGKTCEAIHGGLSKQLDMINNRTENIENILLEIAGKKMV